MRKAEDEAKEGRIAADVLAVAGVGLTQRDNNGGVETKSD